MGLQAHGNLEVANAAAKQVFSDVFADKAPGPWSMFTEVYSTGAERDELVFAAPLSTIREWTGAKDSTSLKAFSQTVKLTKYEYTFDLPRLKVDYDSAGAIGRALGDTIRNARANSDDKIIFDVLTSNSGEGPTGFDAVHLIDTGHILDTATQTNKTTSALSFSTYDSAVQAMTTFLGADGEPLNIFPTTLVVGPKLRKIALEIAGNAERVVGIEADGTLEGGTNVAAAAVGNVFRGDNIDVVVWPRLTGTQDDYWYLMDLSKPSKPVMLKNERDYDLVELTDMRDHPRFEMDKYQWSIEADKKVAAGAWPTIYGGIVA